MLERTHGKAGSLTKKPIGQCLISPAERKGDRVDRPSPATCNLWITLAVQHSEKSGYSENCT